MKGTSSDRRRVRPIPIADFGDEVLERYSKGVPSRLSVVRRVIAFITRHPSVKTTADLTADVVAEFDKACEGLAETHHIQTLYVFRTICNYSIISKYSRYNPFDKYEIPKAAALQPGETRGVVKINSCQLEKILSYLEYDIETWRGHRLYVLVATVAETGLRTADALHLTCEDCNLDGGLIRVSKSSNKSYVYEVSITPKLAKILANWIARVGQGRQGRDYRTNYGTDESERKALADMIRWRSEGWSLERIARELDSMGIPTRTGRGNWSYSTVGSILKRVAIDGTAARVETGPDGCDNSTEPRWIFPNISAPGPWCHSGSTKGYSPYLGLRDAGKAVGIEGLNYESIRRYHCERTRTISHAETSASPKPRPTWPPGRCPVSIRADGVPIAGQPKKVTAAQLEVIRKLLDAGPVGLKGDDLLEKSGCGGYRNILTTLAKDEDWRSRIRLAGNRHRRYRLAMPGDE